MRVAVLADLHDHLPALDAALADIDASGAGRIVLNGDVDGLGPTSFCHATARDDVEIVLVDSPVESFRQAFSAAPDEVATVIPRAVIPRP